MQVLPQIRQTGIRQRSVVPKFGRATVLAFVVAAGATVVVPTAGRAQDLTWDTTTGDTAVVGGTGNWDAATQNWTADAGATNEVWTAGDNATFGGTAGTVTVTGTQEVGNITFDTNGYTLTGGALTYTNTAPGITVTTGTATIGSDITTTTGLLKSGNGTLVLSGANSLDGTLDVARGGLIATNAGALAGVDTFIMQSGSGALYVDLGGATLSVGDFIVNSPGASSLNNGTVSFTGLGQVGYATINTVIAGTGELRKTLSYTTTLNAVNTLTGPVNVNDGQLVIGGTGSILNTSGITIAAAGTLNVDGAGGNAISNTGTINNSGTFILTGSDETVGSIFGSGDINLNANTLTTGDATNVEISGVISGAGDLVKQGAGTLTLSGANTYSGGTAINDGVLTTNNVSALGTGTVTVNGGALTLASDLTIGALAGAGNVTNGGNLLTTGDNNASTTYSGVLSGSGGLTKRGSGEMILTGANTYTGETIVNAGTLTAGSADAFGNGANFRVGGGTADLGGFTITKNSLIVQNGTLRNGTLNMTAGGQFQNANISAVLAGVGDAISAGPGTTILSAANTFTGDIIANRGTFDITGSTVTNTVNITDVDNNGAGIIVRGNSLADTAAVTISNSGVLTVAADETIGSLASASATSSVVLNADLTTGDAGDDIFAGVVSGAGDLIKQGTGTFTLSGVSTGTGTLVNNAGTVALTGTWAGDVNNTAEGTFTTTGTVSGAVTTAGIMNANTGANLNGLVTVTGGTLNANGAVFNADLTVASGGTLDLDADTAVNGTVDLSGAVTNTGGGDKVLSGGQINAGGTIAGGAGNTVTLEAGLIVVSNGYNILNGGVVYDGDLRNAITTGPFSLSGTMLGNVYTAAGATTQFTANTNFSGFDLDVEAATANVDIDAGVAVSNVGQFINTGTTDIGAGGSLTAVSVSNEGGAIINLGTDATLTGTGNTTNNAGTVNVAGGGALIEVAGDYNNLATGIVNFNDAAAKVFDVQAGVIANDGTLNFNAGTTTVNSGGGAIQNTATGDINIANNATLNAAGDTIANAGTIDLLGTGSALTFGTLNNNTGGVVNAQGNLTGNLVNQGSGDFNVVGSMISLGLNITNTDAATLDVGTGTISIVGNLTNTTTSGTGVTVAAGAGFNAAFIENGLSDGSAASLITNNGGLYSDTSIINRVGATLNSNTASSLIAFENTLTNNGTVNIQGRIAGASVVNSGADAAFNVTGNLNLINTNPLNLFSNQNSAVLNVTGGTFWLDALTNTSGGTGTTLATAGVQIAADGGLVVVGEVANDGTGTINNAGSIAAGTITNGDGTNAATLTNTGTLTSAATTGTGITNAAGSTLVSTGTIDADASADAAAFLNAGIADVEGILSGNVTNTGDFEATGNLTHTGAFVNDGTGTVTVSAGVMDSSGTFTNNSTVMGTTLGTAGVNVAAGAELEALNFVNSASSSTVVAGTLDATSGANNAILNLGTMTFDATGIALGGITNTGAAQLTSVGTLVGDVLNNATLNLEGTLDGALNNDGGKTTITGTLTGTGGATTGTVTNQNSAEFVMAPGSLISLDLLDNDATSLVTLNGATIDGDVTNAGDIVGAGIVTGLLDNSGTADMADGLTGDELRVEGGLISAGTYALDLDLVSGTPGVDLLTVLGDTTGDLALAFAPVAGTVLLMDSPLIVVDVDDAAANDFTYSTTGLPTGSGPVVVFTSQAVPNGDIAINTGVTLTLGALLEGVAQIEALTNQGAGRLDPHIPETCGGFGGWGRFTGGETTANSTTENGGQAGDLEVVSDHSGFELGANLGCASELGGWDLTYGVLGGMNSGTSTQALAGDAPTTTAMDFEQLYGGVAGSLTRGALTVDAQLRFAQTDYTVDTATGTDAEALGLASDSFASQTIGFAGAMNYRIPVGQSGFAVVPQGGLSIASTSVDAISFDTGETLAADDYSTTSGYVGATVQYETVAADGQSKFNAFVGANYYNSLSEAQNATLTDAADSQASITTSGVDGYAAVSFGVDYVNQIDPNRQFSMTLRADSRIADEVEGYAVALEVGLRF